MTDKIDNPLAFPSVDTLSNGERYEPLNTGMTLRDYFAAKAMVAFATPHSKVNTISFWFRRAFGLNGTIGNVYHCSYENISKRAYQMADAMLKERSNNLL